MSYDSIHSTNFTEYCFNLSRKLFRESAAQVSMYELYLCYFIFILHYSYFTTLSLNRVIISRCLPIMCVLIFV
jgi:hypothetical protein